MAASIFTVTGVPTPCCAICDGSSASSASSARSSGGSAGSPATRRPRPTGSKPIFILFYARPNPVHLQQGVSPTRPAIVGGMAHPARVQGIPGGLELQRMDRLISIQIKTLAREGRLRNAERKALLRRIIHHPQTRRPGSRLLLRIGHHACRCRGAGPALDRVRHRAARAHIAQAPG